MQKICLLALIAAASCAFFAQIERKAGTRLLDKAQTFCF